MGTSKRLAVLGLAVLSLYLCRTSGALRFLRESIERGRMKNVLLIADTLQTGGHAPKASPDPTPTPLPAVPEEEDKPPRPDEIRETSIAGGLRIRNDTGYSVDAGSLLLAGPSLRLPAEGAQILILHTHGSEAYTQAGLDRYEANDSYRTEDTRHNIVRVGDELAALLEAAGLHVVHDREIYDYPSYTGSYSRSGEAVERALRENPGIRVVFDIHRDALGTDGVIYKTMAEEEGAVASQLMLLVGTDASGLEHPDWRENLALALYLQEAVGRRHPTLLRPVELVEQRYNQHLAPGSLILEVGSSGNTLQEALAAIRLFADGAAPALLALVEAEADS